MITRHPRPQTAEAVSRDGLPFDNSSCHGPLSNFLVLTWFWIGSTVVRSGPAYALIRSKFRLDSLRTLVQRLSCLAAAGSCGNCTALQNGIHPATSVTASSSSEPGLGLMKYRIPTPRTMNTAY